MCAPIYVLFLNLIVSPLQPRHQSFHVRLVHSSTAPDAKGRRSVTVTSNVIGNVFFLEEGNQLLDLLGTQVNGQAHGRGRTNSRILSKEVSPWGFGHEVVKNRKVILRASYKSLQASHRLGPCKAIQVVFDADHRWGVDSGSFEDAVDELSSLGHAEDFGQRAVRSVTLQTFNSLRRQDDHTVGTFTSENLLPGVGRDIHLRPVDVHSEHSRRSVIESQACSVVRNPVEVRNSDSRGGTVKGKHDVVIWVRLL
mmetsp:Transcript_6482/g.8956  ORF Transcript_6482/g.8956 Transcript_6482/m.8956 type:complete len:253 (-) Transcript_6482:571-1329(-)